MPGPSSHDAQIAATTPRQREALRLIREHGSGYVGEDGHEAVVTSGPTCLIDGQPWIDWRTAYALERRGLAEVRGIGEEQTVWA